MDAAEKAMGRQYWDMANAYRPICVIGDSLGVCHLDPVREKVSRDGHGYDLAKYGDYIFRRTPFSSA